MASSPSPIIEFKVYFDITQYQQTPVSLVIAFVSGHSRIRSQCIINNFQLKLIFCTLFGSIQLWLGYYLFHKTIRMARICSKDIRFSCSNLIHFAQLKSQMFHFVDGSQLTIRLRKCRTIEAHMSRQHSSLCWT